MDVEITDAVTDLALKTYVQGPGHPRDAMRAAILSVLPHLTAPAAPTLDGEYWTERFDMLANAVDKLTDLVVDHQAECERLAADPGPADVRVDAAYLRGQKMGMEVARAHGEDGPSDYEVWRDALLVAAARAPRNEPNPMHDRADVEHAAREYADSLRTLGKPVAPEREAGPPDYLAAYLAAQGREETRVAETEAAAAPDDAS